MAAGPGSSRRFSKTWFTPARGWAAGLATALLLLAAALLIAPSLAMAPQLAAGAVPPGREAKPAQALDGLDYTARAVSAHFTGLGYSLNRARSRDFSIPRISLPRLPRGLERLRDVERRKSLFIRTVLPLILMENERLALTRQRVERLRSRLAAGAVLSAGQAEWLDAQFERFGAREGALGDLLHRIGTVPVSLALAQAAMETGWGTSRFALEGHALYGQWTWSRKVKGLVPNERPPGENYRVRTFDSLRESVSVYMMVLNSYRHYHRFREIRAALRAKGGWPNGLHAAYGVSRYSVLRERYTRRLRDVIRHNRLYLLERARLADPPIEPPAREPLRLAALDPLQFPGR